eukprot:TRINITY_DN10411_c0_g1_i6.p1 TRINITY_DN10411_c0_g1~~TRINITY_DN10411_c0_g1_i6.p1  ORF type:complete len:749 (-),score=123.33 TRINITY_DN10411_c0_g1_i6:329-2575(-)
MSECDSRAVPLMRKQRSSLCGWNRRLRQYDSVVDWFRQRRIAAGLKYNQKVLDLCTIEPLKCLQEDDLFGVEANESLPDSYPEPPVYAMRFCPVAGYESLLGIANEDGKIAIQNVHSKEPVTGPLPGWTAHNNAVFDLAWCTVDAQKLVTVSGDHTARLFNVNLNEGYKATLETTFVDYKSSVKCCEWRPASNSEFATGDRANTINIWDTRSCSRSTSQSPGGSQVSTASRPDNFIRNAHSDDSSSKSSSSSASVTGLLWLDQNTLTSISGNDGCIKMWDIRKNYSLYKKKAVPVNQISYPGTSFTQGYTSIESSPNSPYFFVSCQDNVIYQYNSLAINNRPVNIYTGATISSFFIKSSISHCGTYLASGSSDNQLYIWNVNTGCQVATLGPQEETINSVTWNFKENILASCTDDMRHRIWRPSYHCEDAEQRVKGWATMTKDSVPALPLYLKGQNTLPSTPTTSGLRRLQQQTPESSTGRSRLFTPDSRRRNSANSGHTPSIKSFLTPSNNATPSRSNNPNTTPTSTAQNSTSKTPNISRQNSQKRKLDLDDESMTSSSSANKQPKLLDADVSKSLADIVNSATNKANNIRISPKTFESPQKKHKVNLTPRKYASPLKNMAALSPHKSTQAAAFSPVAARDAVRRPLEPIFSPPTANLPNMVRDGTSPRHKCRKRQLLAETESAKSAASTPPKKGNNWLRQLAEERQKKQQNNSASTDSAKSATKSSVATKKGGGGKRKLVIKKKKS